MTFPVRLRHHDAAQHREELARAINMADYAFEISRGNVTGVSGVNKFGRNTDVDTALEAVWDGGGTSMYLPTSTWSATANITDLVSSSTSDNGLTVEVQGLDTSWAAVTQTITLGTPATTSVDLDTALIRVFRMKNTGATAYTGNIQCGVGNATTAFSAANLRAQVTIGFDQTLMTLYSIPAATTGYLTNWGSSLNKGTPASGGVTTILWARTFGGVFRVQDTRSLMVTGTSAPEPRIYNPYPSYSAKTDLLVTAQGSTTNFDVSAGFDLILVDN